VGQRLCPVEELLARTLAVLALIARLMRRLLARTVEPSAVCKFLD
jgi:hypothetical protein